jgi:hypothetical protein
LPESLRCAETVQEKLGSVAVPWCKVAFSLGCDNRAIIYTNGGSLCKATWSVGEQTEWALVLSDEVKALWDDVRFDWASRFACEFADHLFNRRTMKSGAARASTDFNKTINFQFDNILPKRLGPGCRLN